MAKPDTSVVLLYAVAISVVVLAVVGIVSIVGNMGAIGEAWRPSLSLSSSIKTTTAPKPATTPASQYIGVLQATCVPACPGGFEYVGDDCRVEKEYIPSTGTSAGGITSGNTGGNVGVNITKAVDVCKGEVFCCYKEPEDPSHIVKWNCTTGTCTLYSPTMSITAIKSTASYVTVFD